MYVYGNLSKSHNSLEVIFQKDKLIIDQWYVLFL